MAALTSCVISLVSHSSVTKGQLCKHRVDVHLKGKKIV